MACVKPKNISKEDFFGNFCKFSGDVRASANSKNIRMNLDSGKLKPDRNGVLSSTGLFQFVSQELVERILLKICCPSFKLYSNISLSIIYFYNGINVQIF